VLQKNDSDLIAVTASALLHGPRYGRGCPNSLEKDSEKRNRDCRQSIEANEKSRIPEGSMAAHELPKSSHL